MQKASTEKTDQAEVLLKADLAEVSVAGAELFVNWLVFAARRLVSPILPVQSSAPVRLFNAEFYLEQIPIRIRVGELFAVSAASLSLSALAAFFPARAAGRIKPLEVLRKI